MQVEVAGTWIVTRSGVSLGSLMPTNGSRCRGLVPCGWPRESIDTLLPTSQPIVDMAVLYGNSLTWWYYPHIRTHTASPRYLAVNHELLLLIKHGFTNICSAPNKAPKIKTAIANQKKEKHLLPSPLLPPTSSTQKTPSPAPSPSPLPPLPLPSPGHPTHSPLHLAARPSRLYTLSATPPPSNWSSRARARPCGTHTRSNFPCHSAAYRLGASGGGACPGEWPCRRCIRQCRG